MNAAVSKMVLEANRRDLDELARGRYLDGIGVRGHVAFGFYVDGFGSGGGRVAVQRGGDPVDGPVRGR